MDEVIPQLPADVADVLDLGVSLGNNQAFGLVASRCSAAQAAGLERLREEQKFKAITPRWREFCSRYLHISGAEADRIIRLWKEFGAGYFELAQLTRISPKAYREIAASVHDGALDCQGERIELNVENSRRLAAAIAEIRNTTRPPGATPHALEPQERINELSGRAAALIAEFEDIARKERGGANWLEFTALLSRVSTALRRLELASGGLK